MERQAFHHCLTPGQSPSSLPRAGGLDCVCRLGQAGADISVELLDGVVFADQMLKRLASKGKQSRTHQIPPLKTWAKQAGTVAGVGFISQEDLCREGREAGPEEGPSCASPCLWVSVAPPHTRMCVPIRCTAHSHVLHWHMHL
ncbi:hypothetical protein D623_10007190 [Myotis brandtii]|uniref:Uncharacterized protein n=1 Tax=Myotis brandtii TaxID=109478 RepID=S7MY61_MYOBR|nr:hypothetical protein D623_10007190 [Myotis brandtii]